MRRQRSTPLLVIAAGLLCACAGTQPLPEADAIEAVLPVSVDQVKQALIDVLTADGYDVEEEEAGRVTTGYRHYLPTMPYPWNWMLNWRFGVGRSWVVATVTTLSEESTRLTIHVSYEGKDGIFTAWKASPVPLPQSAANQLRLIKNALRLL
ncbi:MAG TPA: hypothetical protein VNK46_00555 [Nitrospiraceae bacterium]|jgi:hypothetical protein|nr:hypothetical protein [Nitrospiraceae bacterium]